MTLRESISSIYPNCPAVYTLILDSNHFYIGSSINLAKRLRDHRGYLDAGRHHNYRLQRNYTGWNDIRVHFSCYETRDEALDAEQRLIDRHYNDPYCINISTDARSLWGNGRGRPTEVTERIANAQRGKAVTDEFRQMCRERMLGHVPTELSRQRRSVTMTGRSLTQEHRDNLSIALKGKLLGRPKSREAEAKRQETLRMMGGMRHTEESRRKIAEYNMKPVEINGVIYPSTKHASEELGIKRTTISARIQNPNYPEYRQIENKDVG